MPCNHYYDDLYKYYGIGCVGLFYFIYLSGAFCTGSTAKYLSNADYSKSIENLVNNHWRQEKAAIVWIIQNFHNETILDGKGNDRKSRVNTQRFRKKFGYRTIEDLSGRYDLERLKGKGSGLIKLQFKKKLVFANKETENLYNNLLHEFIMQSKKDLCQDFLLNIEIGQFEERIMCRNERAGDGPCFNWCCYLLWTLLGLSWFYKVWIDSMSSRKQFTIVKRISI